MASRFFRCYNCADVKYMPGRDFIADAASPVCPNCKLDGTRGKPHAGLIVALKTMHYDPKHEIVKDRGKNEPACGAKRTELVVMTGNPNVVNCLACKATEVFKKEFAEYNAGADEFEQPADFQLAIDPKTAAYVKTGE